MIRKVVWVLSGVCLFLLITGCAVNRATGTVAPGVDS